MIYDTESHPSLPDDKGFIIEKSHFRSNSNTEQTVISQKRNLNLIDAKCDSIILTISIDKYENDHLSPLNTSCSAETEEADDKYENDKIISIIDEDTRNNSKEEKSHKCYGNAGLLEKVFKPIKGSSEDLKQSRRKKRAFSLLDILISTSIVAPLSVGFWRGVWASMDHRAELITTSLTCSLLACLAILRSVRNLIATPLIILIDRPCCVFKFSTRYNVVSYKYGII
ncbi:hypothetical protein ALC57_07808 [Trachymyrmex cornetzi]|uniref:Uncharacterized protein n=1 Tax=Trachymyrmex cornetzi TaxID=471704 RepID=A0A151J7K9_9HYME|nr:hypothetical protein ALC57_07808 [Trachymyrmex cornetzi]